jgi:hypothetical protein
MSIESRVVRENSQLSTQNAPLGKWHWTCCALLITHVLNGGPMTKGQWLLVGAIALSLAVGPYILFFCPTECH